MSKFEIVDKDLLGRIARIYTRHGTVETPNMMPVVNPNIVFIPPGELEKYGAEMIITNAYIIYNNEKLRDEALEKGIHRLLDWDKPIMTDSGSYQLFEYRDIEVSNREIITFQIDIGSDIIVPLDIPTRPYETREKTLKDLEETIKREQEAKDLMNSLGIEDVLLSGVVQGSTHIDLRERSADMVSSIGFDVYPIGGLVPLLEAYSYEKLVEIIAAVKRKLPIDAPVHLFGVGHPIFFALAVALGCDLFDSAAYALYARDDRYLTNERTYFLEDLYYLPCSCPVCSRYDAEEIKEADKEERTLLLAKHNLYVTFSEIRTVKQAIKDKFLWELLERRCRCHPSLLRALKKISREYTSYMEKYDVSYKKTFFYLGDTSARRPEVIRYASKLGNLDISSFSEKKKILIFAGLSHGFELDISEIRKKVEGKLKSIGLEFDEFDIFPVKPPFGPYPFELRETYPIGQSEVILDHESKTVALENALKLMRKNEDIEFLFLYDAEWEHPLIEEIKKHAICLRL